MIRVHPRVAIVASARNDLSQCIGDMINKYDLTTSELASLLANELAVMMRDAIRCERHPEDNSRPGDEA